MLCVTQAKYLHDYLIEITFDNASHGIVNLENFIKKDHREIFQELKDLKKFRLIKIDLDTITWENGADIAPEFLYELLKQQTKTK